MKSTITKAEAEAYLTTDRLARWNHLRYRAGAEKLTKEQAVTVWIGMKPDARQEAKERLG